MRTIRYWRNDISVEEFIKREIVKNAGPDSVVFKDQLIGLCKELEISFETKMSKEDLFNALLDAGHTYQMLAEHFKIGVSSQVYQQSFGITHSDVKSLENKKVLKVVGYYDFRAFGRYNSAPLYDVYQYANMSDDDMKQLLQEYCTNKRKGHKR
ncbi:MAG: hypothetical protein IJ958_04260 [Agathobacter sp.]|nr:hypothetical protein [Agathobacter sp.]